MTSEIISLSTKTLAVTVLVKPEPEGKTSASILGLPHYRAVGDDRASVLAELQSLLAEELQNGEVVTLDVQLPGTHPWTEFAGMYKDSELFESVLEHIQSLRQELNQQGQDEEFQV
jgi:hypothetical protein